MQVNGYNDHGVSAMTELERAISIMQRLSVEKMEVALYLLELLALKEELEATEEVARDSELVEMIRRARDARQVGRMNEFVPWETRRSV